MTVGAAFAEALARLHRRLGGDPAGAAALSAAGSALWQATADGHACLALEDPVLRERLAASPAVAGAGGGERPLVLDGATLYMQRLWLAECRLAAALDALDAPAPLAPLAPLAGPGSIDAMLDEVAPTSGVDPQQRAAIASALTRRLAIVTGGPGTGKTTTMARLLVAFGRLAPDARVAIAAPTGKAAARLAQALAAQLAMLDPGGGLARRLPASGMTVHRLLGLRGDDAPLATAAAAWDLVIVDEASMLDLELACALATAVPESGRLVLAGDRDQLASVEAGAVFAEACASRLEGVVRLERNYRQADAPALTALSRWLRDRCEVGDASPAEAAPFDPGAGVARLPPAGPDAIALQALSAWEPALAAIGAGRPAHEVLRAFDAHRVLCAIREGPLGVAGLNAVIAAGVRRRVGARPAAPWYCGRLVIVIRNRPEMELFNGDVGVCLPDPGAAGALAVAFEAGGGIRWVPVRQMPAHEDAFAVTVHKSQGSEFDSVALVPAPRGHLLNTRELLYTGATRARRSLTIWADAAALDEGAARRTARHGRLADRIGALRAGRDKERIR